MELKQQAIIISSPSPNERLPTSAHVKFIAMLTAASPATIAVVMLSA